MIITSLPMKVYASVINDRRSQTGECATLTVHSDSDFHIPFLPNVHRIDFRVFADQLVKADPWFGSRIENWEQAFEFMRRMHDRWKPFWVEVSNARVSKIAAAGEKRKLNPTFWYELEVEAFSVLDWPKDKMVQAIVQSAR